MVSRENFSIVTILILHGKNASIHVKKYGTRTQAKKGNFQGIF
jgi:hypothetical protein